MAALVTADAAVHHSLTDVGKLTAQTQLLVNRAGAAAARQMCQLVDGRSESPLETISRLRFLALQQQPELQIALWTASGFHLARVDFFWAQLGIVGEADGRVKYGIDSIRAANQTNLWLEKKRQDRLTELGLVVFRWGWQEAMTPGLLTVLFQRAATMARQLRSAGIDPQVVAGPPPGRR